jgi:hypothetical protein
MFHYAFDTALRHLRKPAGDQQEQNLARAIAAERAPQE